MDDRAFRISLAHLTAMAEPKENTGTLDEAQVKKLIQDALKSYYPTYIHSFLRNLDINQIISLMFFTVHQFGETAPSESLLKILNPLKIKILNAIGDSAMLAEGSLLEKIMTYFKENPTNSEDEIDQYVQKVLGEIKINLKRTVPKLERILSQY